jgi:hypothetical protein
MYSAEQCADWATFVPATFPGSSEGSQRDTAWIRQAIDAESLAGRGVKCWVQPGAPLQPLGSARAPKEVRVLVGNRRLLAEEDVPLPRCVCGEALLLLAG